jgi:ABC-2 type transport system ATP-binding protein
VLAGAAHQTVAVIEVYELTKRYRAATVVDGLTFRVEPGTVTGFLGPNGAGKSTTIRMMLDLARPDRGYTRIDGSRYADLREPLRKVGTMLEAAGPHKTLRAVDHLRWLARSQRIGQHRVAEVLELVGLAGAARQRVGTLSLGMTQRLGLAAALIGDPPVLVLDEPANGLDPEGIRWFREFIRGLAAEGRTVFVSSHLMAEMAVTADRLVVIDKGRLLASTSTAEFLRLHASSYVRVRSPEPDRLRLVLEGAGMSVVCGTDGAVEVTEATSADISRVASASGLVIEELSTHLASLEEAFLTLTQAEGGQRHDG